LACVAPAVDDPSVRSFVARANAQAVALVEQRLRSAVDAGESPHDYPVAVRPRNLSDMWTGMGTRARLGASRAQLLKDAEDAAAPVLDASRAPRRSRPTREMNAPRRMRSSSRSQRSARVSFRTVRERGRARRWNAWSVPRVRRGCCPRLRSTDVGVPSQHRAIDGCA
jgi:hypothetical protein